MLTISIMYIVFIINQLKKVRYFVKEYVFNHALVHYKDQGTKNNKQSNKLFTPEVQTETQKAQ